MAESILSLNIDANLEQITHLHELNLDQFQKWHEHEEQVIIEDGNLEDLQIQLEIGEVDEELAEEAEATILIRKYDHIYQQLLLTILPEHHTKLKDLKRVEWYGLKMSSGMVYTEYEKGTIIQIPGANDQQIKDLEVYMEEDVPKKDKIQRARIQLRIDRLKLHQFILMPVQDAIFAAKARTDAIRKQLPKTPEDVLKAKAAADTEEERENLKFFIDKLNKELSAKDLDRTQAEVRERLKLKKQIRRWQSKTETTIYQLADQFLTHFLLPVDEEYSGHYAEIRRPYIRKLTMDKVLPFINFILAVLKI